MNIKLFILSFKNTTMFWHKKEEKSSLPDLPPQPNQFSNLPMEEENKEPAEIHGLPSFPDSPMNKGFSQTAIKDAVETPEIKDYELPELSGGRNFKTVELEEWSPGSKIAPESHEWQPSEVSRQIMPPPEHHNDYPIHPVKEGDKVFVKIDKYHAAKKILSGVTGKLDEIDDLIKKIREVKQREEQELSSWEKEILTTKARIEEIDLYLFGREND